MVDYLIFDIIESFGRKSSLKAETYSVKRCDSFILLKDLVHPGRSEFTFLHN